MNQENNKNTTQDLLVSKVTSNRAKKLKVNKRVRNMAMFTIALLLIGLFFLFMYLVYWKHEVTTDDSYVNGHIVYVNAQVSGTVNQIMVEDTDTVQQGDLLILLDQEDYRLVYDKALNNLKNQISQFKNLNNSVKQAKLSMNLKKTALVNAERDYKRRVSLLKAGAISQEELSHLKSRVDQSQEDLRIAQQAYQIALNNVNQGDSAVEQPAIKIAIADLKQAWLNLQRTEVKAPISGQIAKRNIQIGQRIAVGQNLLSVIPQANFWVDANFKESQLKKIHQGEEVEMTSDLYGSNVIFHGNVIGLSAGTGSAFSLLPAQNASGNWIKVVQRVPVRISLRNEELEKYPLKIGLSMKTKVFHGSRKNQPSKFSYYSHQNATVAPVDYTPIETIITDILSGN